MSGDTDLPDEGVLGAMSSLSERKRDHLELALLIPDAPGGHAGWADIHLLHHSVPVTDADEVSLAAQLLGRHLKLPLLVLGMTGGYRDATEVNRELARAAERAGAAIGVGSQRAALEHPELAGTYAVVREEAPTAFVLANIGISQLVEQSDRAAISRDDVARVVDMVRADALAVHLNFLEEAVQPEGQTKGRDALAALEALVASSPVPVIAKETGGGISPAAARALADVGVAALDVGGRGGTSFVAIEAERSLAKGDKRRAELGAALSNWGIPTAVTVRACAEVLPTIAAGGVRSGVDAAKALALGACVVGVGRPLLEHARRGDGAVEEWISSFELQLRTAVFLTGLRSVADLPRAERVVLGETRDWMKQLGLLDP